MKDLYLILNLTSCSNNQLITQTTYKESLDELDKMDIEDQKMQNRSEAQFRIIDGVSCPIQY